MKAIYRATVIVAVFNGLAASVQAQTLPEELHKMDALRSGANSPFADVEAKGQSLLGQHTDADSQGKIYFQMAEVYAQSAPDSPKVVEYAQKALTFPLDPQKQLRVCSYWGTALQLARGPVAGEQLAAMRREAVMPYLQGLKLALQYDLPDDPPDIPRGFGFIHASGDAIPPGLQQRQRVEEARQKAFQIAVPQARLIQEREILIGQVALMYSRMPFATDEIRTLATQIIQDKHAVDRLMAAVEKAINERTKKSVGGDPNAKDPPRSLTESAPTAAAKVIETPPVAQPALPAKAPVGDFADAGPDQLGPDLWHIRELRTGAVITDFTELDRRVAEAITKHPNPNDQGRIYLEALTVHALSGLSKPEQAISYAQKAEPLLTNPVDICQLYLSWGDACQMKTPGARGPELETNRRAATVQYLKGMRSALQAGIPEVLPVRPSPPEGINVNRIESILPTNPESLPPEMRQRFRQQQQEAEARQQTRVGYFAALDRWEHQKEVVERRDYCRDLIVNLYCKIPFNTAELEKLATDTLQDRKSVDDLVEKVKNRIKERTAKSAAKLLEKEKPATVEDINTKAPEASTQAPVVGATPPQPEETK